MAKEFISIKGARANNLKNIDLKIPRDKLVVFTGLSGSGKTSLAFDTIYAEGRRRYVESLSSYARMFLGQMDKPDVDDITGLSPAISIDQKTTSKNPRSTVGTVTEIYDYLRLLYARVGKPHCPVCGREITQQTVDQIVDRICEFPDRTRLSVLAPVVRGRKGEHQKLFEDAKKSGFARVRVDGNLYELSETIKLEKNIKHTIEIVVDRLIIKEGIRQRLTDSVETALHQAGGLLLIVAEEGDEILFSQNFVCPEHGFSMEELSPRMFSFNNPFGACPECDGLGFLMKVDPQLVVPKPQLSINEGAIHASGWYLSQGDNIAKMYFRALSAKYGFSLDTPFDQLTKDQQNLILYGNNGEKLDMKRNSSFGSVSYNSSFEGVVPNLERRFKETNSDFIRREIEMVMSDCPCLGCRGKRLRKDVLGVTVGDKNITDVTDLSVTKAIEYLESLQLSEKDLMIAERVLKEIIERLNFLKSVGLEYLTLSRSAGTLSGGESQRIRLATQIGSSLMGVLYILDEPSIGLHQRDNDKLIATLKRLRDLGNTLIVVEHDEDTMLAADYLVDIGPGAGIHGGEVVCCGTPQEVMKCEGSLTGEYLSGKRRIAVPSERRGGNGNFLEIVGAQENNLKKINVKIPLGTFTAVTGVSGSGKSSLINSVLYKTLARDLNGAKTIAGKVQAIKGLEHLDKVIDIDQSPIGRTPRSNPATYTSVFTDIRDLFASTNGAKARGYNSSRFSFNVHGGRCEACQGDGIVKIEMHFLPDVYIPCEICKGKRYNRETLEVKYKDKSIADVLEMTVEEGLNFFENHPKIRRKLQTLYDVGLSYVKIGQPSTTLSGGEAQRVKLATELSKRSTGQTIYILDEPTTGLHTADVEMLIKVLQRLVDGGNTVVVIEHNLDMIKTADYIIDLGPEGGDKGGTVVATGTPEEICGVDESYTGRYLKKMLEK
ncbi:MAG: excinuclease ABC subunit UvrA [Clostridia bacterium]|nr:excinuclease ABC subunit UvrA [Clostridia bacterium]